MRYEISGSYAFCQPTKSVAPKMYDFSGVMRYGGYALGGSQLYSCSKSAHHGDGHVQLRRSPYTIISCVNPNVDIPNVNRMPTLGL